MLRHSIAPPSNSTSFPRSGIQFASSRNTNPTRERGSSRRHCLARAPGWNGTRKARDFSGFVGGTSEEIASESSTELLRHVMTGISRVNLRADSAKSRLERTVRGQGRGHAPMWKECRLRTICVRVMTGVRQPGHNRSNAKRASPGCLPESRSSCASHRKKASSLNGRNDTAR